MRLLFLCLCCLALYPADVEVSERGSFIKIKQGDKITDELVVHVRKSAVEVVDYRKVSLNNYRVQLIIRGSTDVDGKHQPGIHYVFTVDGQGAAQEMADAIIALTE